MNRTLPYRFLLIIFVLCILVISSFSLTYAQDEIEPEERIQVINGQIGPNQRWVYRLSDRTAGETIYVRMENTSGNLDPIIFLLGEGADLAALDLEMDEELTAAIAEERDPLISLPEIYDRHSLVWNDDYRTDSSAAFEFEIPEDGSYKLIVAGSRGVSSFGEFRLLIGLNAPEIIEGRGTPTGEPIATLSEGDNPVEKSVKQVTGSITSEEPKQSVTLRSLNPGDTIYAYVESTSGDLAPVLALRNYNGKPLRSGNVSAEEPMASLSYTLDQNIQNHRIEVASFEKDGRLSEGTYRLIVGINAPEVLQGEANPTERSPLEEPIEVRVGVKLRQITEINQQSEKFGAVAEVRMDWQDPTLAFNPDDCQCDFVSWTGDRFVAYADDNNILLPEFTLFNQQGNRWVQNRIAVVSPDGRVSFAERFTTDFQAPLFDFVRFPFDEQEFFIQVVSVAPESFYTFDNPAELSGVGDQLGEEEWFVVSSDTEITVEGDRASYWLKFNMQRHLNFYIYRIFLPIGLVILVSWLTFFLKDYGKRVDVSSANLLVFVAYNFTVSGDLPRLGYLTFMDSILIGTFIVSIFVVLFSVVLKRLETDGRVEVANRIDRPMILLYPLLYVFGAVAAYWLFLG